MVANNRLEIKVVVVYGSDGNPLSYENIQQT
jgi:hypothetical protein